jgi:hypothetical protein
VTEGEQAPSAPAPSESTSGEKPRRSRAQERIEELAREKRLALEFADLQKRRADELEARINPPAPATSPGKPKLSDYPNEDAWSEAVAEWAEARAAEKAAAKLREETAQREARSSQERAAAAFKAREAKLAAVHEDYYDVAYGPVTITPEMAQVIQSLDAGPEVAYHLGKHPEIADRIAILPPHLAAAELGKIEALVTKPAPKPDPKVTKAPEPLSPISSTGGTAQKDPMKMSWEEFCEWRAKGGGR